MPVRKNYFQNPRFTGAVSGVPAGGSAYSFLTSSGARSADAFGNVSFDMASMAAGARFGLRFDYALPAGTGPVTASIVGFKVAPPLAAFLHVQLFNGATFNSEGFASFTSSGVTEHLSVTVTPTGTVDSAHFYLWLENPTSSTVAAPSGVFFSKPMIELAAASGDYFDGSSLPPFSSWDGVADGSSSTLYVPVVSLTPHSDAGPCPRVEILINDLPPETQTVTLHRISGGRTWKVRGAVNAFAVGGLSRLDMEAPAGAISYRAEMFDADGNGLGFTEAASVTLDFSDTWLHNPLDPSGALPAQLRSWSLRDLSRPSNSTVHFAQGRSRGVVVAGARQGLRGVDASVLTDTAEDADKMLALLGSPDDGTPQVPIICLRIGKDVRLRVPRTLFLAVLDQRERDLTYAFGGETIAWDMVGDEVDPPAVGLVSASYTYDDLDASFATYSALDAAYLTYLDIDRDYGLADVVS